MITTKEYVEIDSRNPFYSSTPYEGQEEDKQKIREYNKALLEKYPWLTPTNRWSGKSIIDCANGEKGYWPGEPDKLPEYNYEHTELDALPSGWRVAFGDAICEELDAELRKTSFRDNYRILEIKEKYGELCWYDNGSTPEMFDIVLKYEEISGGVCIRCGKPAQWCSKGWISYFCEDCAKKDFQKIQEHYEPTTFDQVFEEK